MTGRRPTVGFWISSAALLAGCTPLLGGGDVVDGGADGATTGMDAAFRDAPTATIDAADGGLSVADAGADATATALDGATDASTPSDAAVNGPDAAGNVPIAIVAEGYYTCVLLASGDVYCWGANDSGQIGNGGTPGNNVEQATHVATDTTGQPFGEVIQVGLGDDHACALKRNGDVYCWGNGNAGQLGDTVTVHNVSSPQKVAKVSRYTAIAVGGFATCGLGAGSRLYCWGSNYKSRLGHAVGTNGDVPDQNDSSQGNPNPVAVQSLGPASAIALGAYFSCAIDDAGASCWGEDQDVDPGVGSGELGDLGAAGDNSAIPVRVSTPAGVKHLGAGQSFACAWADSTGATCWGSNVYGELATGGFASPLGPTPLALGDASVVEMEGTYGALVALTSDQVVWTAGYNGDGELANGTVGQEESCPVGDGIVPGGPSCLPSAAPALDPTGAGAFKAAHIAAGFLHACAVGEDHAVYCWGDNSRGQLGIGVTGAPHALPTKVVGLP